MQYNLNYVRVLTENFNKMYTFYSEVLGMQPRFNEKNGPYEEFKIQGAILSIFDKKLMELALEKESQENSDSTDNFNDNNILIFSIPSVDEFYQSLKEKVKIEVNPTDRPDWRIRTVHLRDPDGNLLEFNQPLQLQ